MRMQAIGTLVFVVGCLAGMIGIVAAVFELDDVGRYAIGAMGLSLVLCFCLLVLGPSKEVD